MQPIFPEEAAVTILQSNDSALCGNLLTPSIAHLDPGEEHRFVIHLCKLHCLLVAMLN